MEFDILSNIIINNISNLILKIFDYYSNLQKKIASQIKQSLTKLIQLIDRKYPNKLDESIKLQIEDKNNGISPDWLLKFIALVIPNSRHSKIDVKETNLFLSIHHPQHNVRLLSIKKLEELSQNQNISNDTLEVFYLFLILFIYFIVYFKFNIRIIIR
jgi:hypothetical protein